MKTLKISTIGFETIRVDMATKIRDAFRCDNGVSLNLLDFNNYNGRDNVNSALLNLARETFGQLVAIVSEAQASETGAYLHEGSGGVQGNTGTDIFRDMAVYDNAGMEHKVTVLLHPNGKSLTLLGLDRCLRFVNDAELRKIAMDNNRLGRFVRFEEDGSETKISGAVIGDMGKKRQSLLTEYATIENMTTGRIAPGEYALKTVESGALNDTDAGKLVSALEDKVDITKKICASLDGKKAKLALRNHARKTAKTVRLALKG